MSDTNDRARALVVEMYRQGLISYGISQSTLIDNLIAAALRDCEQRVWGELNEQWIDEKQTVWTRPTAWAYAQVCRANEEKRERIEQLQARVRELEEAGKVTP